MAREGEDRGGAWLSGAKGQSATHAVEKTPQFKASLERFAERAAERLGAAYGALFTAAVEKTRNGKLFAVLGENEGQPAAVLASARLDQRMAVLCEPGLVKVIVATMFSIETANDEGEPASERPLTALEMRMIRDVAASLAEALRDAFAPVADFDLEVETAEAIEDETLLGAKDGAALLVPATIKAPSGPFGVKLMFPHPFLTALQGAFARGPAPGATKLDPVWSSRMEQRVTEASLTLTAVLDQFEMSLADVSTLRVGHILPLSEEGAQGRVRIESGERGVFVCSLGERNGRYALEVEDIIARPVEAAYPGANVPA